MKFCMGKQAAFDFRKPFLTPLCIPTFQRMVATVVVLVNEVEQKYFERLVGKNFYFLIIAKQFYVILRPSSLSFFAFDCETGKSCLELLQLLCGDENGRDNCLKVSKSATTTPVIMSHRLLVMGEECASVCGSHT